MLEHRAHAGLAAGLAERGQHDLLQEQASSLFDDGDLEGFLGTKVREQAALGQPGCLGEAADRESGDADQVRELERSRQDRLPGVVAFRHDLRIERSCDLSSRVRARQDFAPQCCRDAT